MSRNAESIFHEARARSELERGAYLDEACGDDQELRRRVGRLLRAEAAAGGFLVDEPAPELQEGTPAHDSDSTVDEYGLRDVVVDAAQSGHAEQPGQILGRYKLLERIGEGGFGVVWMAEQREPVKRTVALKIIKLGMDTKQVIARFEAERQALAMMDHPNIANVLDAGSTDNGRPYFVMEYIQGIPIVEYCDTGMLDAKHRLALFINVCHAIQHAHQKGIIHRDIKPSNVMITAHDGRPVPKVIDFGVAKATNPELAAQTQFTQHRQMIGTPAYMSPEQAEMTGLDIDTRSDIYSLGVLLYQLLTGTTPFDPEGLLSKGYAEMVRIICEVEPQKPSTRLSTLGETATRAAQDRHSEAKRLVTKLRGDLDWIVMKCLEKDRSRRYETANGLAADIERHLNDQPVVAGPPNAAYRMGKFVRRNRAGVIAASLVVLALLIGAAGTTGGMFWALEQKARAEIAEEATERELARANEIKHLIIEMLESVDPVVARSADTTLLKGILDDTAARLAKNEIVDELIAAELRDVVGRAYYKIGLYDHAEGHTPLAVEIRTRLLGEEAPSTLRSMGQLALLRQEQNRYAEAEPLSLKTAEFQKRILGEEHKDTLGSLTNLGALYVRQGRHAEAEQLYRETLATMKRVLGEEHVLTISTMHDLARVLLRQGRHAEAEPLHLAGYEARRRTLGDEHPHTLKSMHNLAYFYGARGRYSEAESLYKKAFDVRRRIMGAEHPATLGSMHNLAGIYRKQGRFAEAEPLYLDVLEIRKRVLGDEHRNTLASMNDMAILYASQGRFDEAEPYFRQAMEAMANALGDEHPWTLSTMSNLASIYMDQRRYAEAEPLNIKTLEIRKRRFGESHPQSLQSMNNLAQLYHHQHRYAEAEALFLPAVEGMRRELGGDHPTTLGVMHNLASMYVEQHRLAEAESLHLNTLETRKRTLGEEHPDTLISANSLAILYLRQRRYGEAEPLLNGAVEAMKRVLGEEHPETLGAIINVGRLYNGAGRCDEARKIFETSLPVNRRILGMNHPYTRYAIRELAEVYVKVGRRDDALPLFRELLELQLDAANQPDADARTLIAAARALLTEEFPDLVDAGRAMDFAERACALEEAGGSQLWEYLDTLALAQHLTGDTSTAIETQRRALDLMPEGAGPQIAERLVEYEAALAAGGVEGYENDQ